MKFPYGVSDFGKIIQNGFFYQDRTHLIPALEDAGDQLLFLRPRRFGKSLLLSMLEHYYDVRQAEAFESLFGQLAIYANPTPLHHRYFILHWDFSLVKPQGDVKDIERALHQHINLAITCCASQYDLTVPIDDTNAIQSLGELLRAVRETPYKLYLFIDEYDNFANEVLMARQDHYEALLYGEGLFKTLFKAVKAAAAGQGLDRVFITGVSPVALSDITSGYNVAKNIYLDEDFNTLCGFTESEVAQLLSSITTEGMDASLPDSLHTLRTFYNGYRFSQRATESVYNPTLSLYFLDYLQKKGHYPDEMLDDNLSMDRQRLAYIAGLLGKGNEVFIEALAGQNNLVIARLSRRFGVRDLQRQNQESNVLPSLLYYFGVLTLAGQTGLGKLVLKIPNLVSRSLYVEQLQDALLTAPDDFDERESVAEELYVQGNLQPVCTFIEQRLLPVLSNRDYRWSNELLIKVMFMTVLFNDLIYMMVSETEVDHGYVDLSLIVRPDKRQFGALDILLEFKYLSLQELGMTGLEIKTAAREELLDLPAVVTRLDEAKAQAQRYGTALRSRYGLPDLACFAVVALGLERLVFVRCE